MTLKLQIVSDLHLSQAGLELPRTGADVIVLAGDIARPRAAIQGARTLPAPVLYVPGNHEFYGGSLDGTIAQLRDLCAGSNVRLLHDEEVRIDGVRILGSTLWSEFQLPDMADQDAAEQAATPSCATSSAFASARPTRPCCDPPTGRRGSASTRRGCAPGWAKRMPARRW